MRVHPQRECGFTLIELLVVIGIIGILAAMLIPVIVQARCHAKEGATRAFFVQIGTACATYHSDFGGYPMSIQDPLRTGGPGSTDSTPLITELRNLPMASSRAQPYLDLRARDVQGGVLNPPSGPLVSALGLPIFYTEQSSVMPKQAPLAMEEPMTFDLWTASCDCPAALATNGPGLKSQPAPCPYLSNWQ